MATWLAEAARIANAKNDENLRQEAVSSREAKERARREREEVEKARLQREREDLEASELAIRARQELEDAMTPDRYPEHYPEPEPEQGQEERGWRGEEEKVSICHSSCIHLSLTVYPPVTH